MLEIRQRLAIASVGKNYQECFDLESAAPKKEYLDFVENIKKELSKVGIRL